MKGDQDLQHLSHSCLQNSLCCVGMCAFERAIFNSKRSGGSRALLCIALLPRKNVCTMILFKDALFTSARTVPQAGPIH